MTPLLKSTVTVLLFGGLVQAVDVEKVCAEIHSTVSEHSDVFYPGELQTAIRLSSSRWLIAHVGSDGYARDIEHWSLSSSQNSTCSVEPGTVEDVSVVVRATSTGPSICLDVPLDR